MKRPNPVQWIGYSCGAVLPEELREWVRNDLTGPWAGPRHVVRQLVPLLPVFALAFLLPGELWLQLAVILLGLLLALFYIVAYMPMNRAHRLMKHGFPQDLESPARAARRAAERAAYEAQYPH
ncbi:DUF5313 family protein [Nocardia tengchongensis]|uniref:DUF5313 family protein n=1 Tax=Nocardia tengchongensis TaxID=2055889 RepID=A0ABX8CRT3_9NOCA|nr:DUF5313 family protein [Nocardia tengchongensis]QVI21225.1 DUF5313 family protein [Nocardia tengchongensis]